MDLNPRRCRLSRSLEKPIANGCTSVLFGCGNKALLQAEGMAIVGSRDAPTDDLRYTQQLAAKLAQQGICVILVVREVLMNVQWPRLWRSGNCRWRIS